MENETYKKVVSVVKVAPVVATFETIVDILSNGLAQECGFDKVDYEWDDYDKAKQALLDSGFENPCLEDVQAQMLMMGLPLRLHMAEEEPDKEWYVLTVDKLIEGIEKYDASKNWKGRAWDVCNGDPESRLDFWDYDAILQFALYGEDIIG